MRVMFCLSRTYRLSKVVEENLYAAMEDFRFDVVIEVPTPEHFAGFTALHLGGATTSRSADLATPGSIWIPIDCILQS